MLPLLEYTMLGLKQCLHIAFNTLNMCNLCTVKALRHKSNTGCGERECPDKVQTLKANVPVVESSPYVMLRICIVRI